MVKNCLFKVVGRKKLDYFQLLTALSYLQGSINDRLQTYRFSNYSSLEVINPKAIVLPFYKNSVFFNLEDDGFANRPLSKEVFVRSLQWRGELLL